MGQGQCSIKLTHYPAAGKGSRSCLTLHHKMGFLTCEGFQQAGLGELAVEAVGDPRGKEHAPVFVATGEDLTLTIDLIQPALVFSGNPDRRLAGEIR